LTWPLKLILPHSPEQRPRWLIRLGLFLYDHLGGRKTIPATTSLDLRSAPEGEPISSEFSHAFAYYDVWVDDARLVLLNALDAAERGAEIRPRTRFLNASREGDLWRVRWRDEQTGVEGACLAKALVNAAGPWVEKIIREMSGVDTRHHVRLVKGSHIIMKRWWQGEHGYVLQNTDKRLIFVNPYFDDLALIGTTDIPYEDAAEAVQITPSLSVFGGKLTTYRKLAEHGLEKLRSRFRDMGSEWTGSAALPGGDLGGENFEDWYQTFKRRHAWLPDSLARHLARCYGARADQLLDGASRIEDLGIAFGELLYEREVQWLIDREWAVSADDILWRRTKHGLFLENDQREQLEQWLRMSNSRHTSARSMR